MNLKTFILAAGTAVLPAEELIAENIISSPNATALYGDTFQLIAEMYPDLNVMLVNRDFIPGAKEAYANHDLSFYDTCNWGDMTDEMGKAVAARAEMDISMAQAFFKYASGENIFIPEAVLINAIKEDPTVLAVIATSVVSGAYYDTASAITLNHRFPSMEGTVGIITLPNEAMDPLIESAGLSGLSTQYLTITATGQDHMFHTMGHEIGHLLKRDGADDIQNDETYCSSVNVESSDRGVIGEAHAEIEVAQFLNAAAQLGLTSGEDVIDEIGHLRSIGSLMIPGNSYVVDTSEDMTLHLTNTAHDPTEENFREAFDYSSLKGISVLPLLINSFADSLAGYAISIEKKEMIAKIPSFFTDEDKEFYNSLPNDPAEVANYAYQYAWIGANERQYKQNPLYHYAAIRYMHDNKIFEDIKSALRPEYAAALDDMVADYMTGINEVAPNLLSKFEPTVDDVSNQFDYSQFAQQIKDVDVLAIGNDIIAVSEAYESDPYNNSGYKGLHQTTRFITDYMLR